MKAIIIDDEKNSTELTSSILRDYCPRVKILATASSVGEAYKTIIQLQPDLIFLDVQMQDGTGFDLLNKFPLINFKIIFITAHQEFAVNAFKRSAIDYLLKPIAPPDIINAVSKAEQQFNNNEWNSQLKTLLGNVSEPLQQRQKLVLKTMERIYSVHLNEIIRFQSEGSYTEVYLEKGKKIVVSKLLKEFDELLSSNGFIRVHQSHLINSEFIFCFEKTQNLVTMKDDSTVPVSVRKKETLMSLLNSI
ncbi:DNA-binding response regulator [Sphingobacteriaceae bacterium]|nr:DNA-binding response regulator [Sphingobacteriaceae bacterium]